MEVIEVFGSIVARYAESEESENCLYLLRTLFAVFDFVLFSESSVMLWSHACPAFNLHSFPTLM